MDSNTDSNERGSSREGDIPSAEDPHPTSINVAARLVALAQSQPNQVAVAEPQGYRSGKRVYKTITYRELNEDSDRIAHGLHNMGVSPGMRLALLVRPGIDFVSCVFGALKSGAVMILIDPGMGKNNLLKCLEQAHPEGFIALSTVQALRIFMKRRFPHAKYNLTVGHRWFWGGPNLASLRRGKYPGPFMADTVANDPAAIIFTTGSTGAPKGVLYEHITFESQVKEISTQYGIQAGQIDLPGFPMFGLFNCAMGSTAVIPDMDASHPAQVDPRKILEAVRDWNVTQSFGSPTIWDVVSQWCKKNNQKLESIRMILSAGAPVQEPVLRRVLSILPEGAQIHTPYGATEALPVASISAAEVLSDTAALTREGAGVCVGRRFSGIDWKIIRITEAPIPTLSMAEELPNGEIGELIVTGDQITREYVTCREMNAMSKIRDGEYIWHRMGDVGYLDDMERFWFCGRMAHHLETEAGPMFTIPCEAIFNQHPDVTRSALVGIHMEPDSHYVEPVIIIQPQDPAIFKFKARRETLCAELLELARNNPKTAHIQRFLFHPAFPVDIRHNAKIFREKLTVWAHKQLQIR